MYNKHGADNLKLSNCLKKKLLTTFKKTICFASISSLPGKNLPFGHANLHKQLWLFSQRSLRATLYFALLGTNALNCIFIKVTMQNRPVF